LRLSTPLYLPLSNLQEQRAASMNELLKKKNCSDRHDGKPAMWRPIGL